MVNPKFMLRTLQPSDSSALIKLISEFDGDMTTNFQVDPYTAIISGTEHRTVGVVVDCAGYDGLVGVGTVRFSHVQFNSEILPLAFLDGLKVHKDFRGQGLGYEIASWRIQQARQAYGERCVIATGMLNDNHASHAVAQKWCREFIESAVEVLVMPLRKRAPKALDGIIVHELEKREYEEFSVKQNEFYRNHNLYSRGDTNSITNALAVSANGRKPYRFFVAVDIRGNLLAGAQTWARGMLKSDTINNLPTPIRILNHAVHLLPPDFKLRDVIVSGLWFESDRSNVARYLWEMMRWECKDQGTILAANFGPHDPAREAVPIKPWHQPRPKITIAMNGPAPIDREKSLFSFGRV
jgi:predicted N-acetyltransferase YhbS